VSYNSAPWSQRSRWLTADAGYADVPIQGIISHRQVTDAYGSGLPTTGFEGSW